MVNYTNVKPSGVANGTNAVLHVGLDFHKNTTVVAVAIRYLVALRFWRICTQTSTIGPTTSPPR